MSRKEVSKTSTGIWPKTKTCSLVVRTLTKAIDVKLTQDQTHASVYKEVDNGFIGV